MALFQRRRSRVKGRPGDQPLGLVVGPRAIVIMKPGAKVDGVQQPDEVLFDGVREMEKEYIRRLGDGRQQPVTFEDDDDQDSGMQPN